MQKVLNLRICLNLLANYCTGNAASTIKLLFLKSVFFIRMWRRFNIFFKRMRFQENLIILTYIFKHFKNASLKLCMFIDVFQIKETQYIYLKLFLLKYKTHSQGHHQLNLQSNYIHIYTEQNDVNVLTRTKNCRQRN